MRRTTHQLAVRVSLPLRRAFEQCARDHDRTASQLIREYMTAYLRAHGRAVPSMVDVGGASNEQ